MTAYNRVYNFSAGPSVLPLPVLEKVRDDLLNYQGSGQSVMEMSHRSAEFKKIIQEAEADLRDLMNIPDNYKVLFLQGGGTLQFSMIPLNLLRKSGKADYAITGSWAKKAYKEACRFGDINVIASSEKDTFTWVPKFGRDDIRSDADYVYITTNNTIYGTAYNYVPETGDIPLIADMSSNILSQQIDVSKFGIIWAGAQKNIGPAGVTIAIVREDLIGYAGEKCPGYLDYKIHADNDSMYNTPPCFAAIGAMNSELGSKKWLFAGIGLQLGTGYTVAFLVYQIGTLITEGHLGTGFVPGLIAVAIMVAIVVMVVIRSNRKLAAEYSLHQINKKSGAAA